MSKILVAGAAGFIGSNLIRTLIKNPENQIFALDNLITGRESNLSELENLSNFSFIKADINEPLEGLQIDKIDTIYNLACPASPPKYQANSIFTLKTSFLGSLNLLELAKKYNAKYLFASTSEVYGDPEVTIQTESYRGNVNTVGPRACYDEGKRVAETLCWEYRQQFNLDVKIFRVFNTYGPFMDPFDGRVVSNFINQALQNQDITIYGDGSQTRSFQYIDDLIDGILKLSNSKDFYGPVNLGNPVDFTIKQLADKVLKLIPNSNSKIIYKPLPVDDPLQRKPDISLAKSKLDWEPKVSLEEGLLKVIEYFRNILI
jgi:UDP-glucuronate decarboxylase